MHRFYVPDIEFAVDADVELPEAATHHAMRVLRLHEEDQVEIFNGKGVSATGTIHFTEDSASVHISTINQQVPDKLKIVLIQSLVGKDKMNFIVEKACELGVSKLVIFPSTRTDIKLNLDKVSSKLQKWTKKTVAACEQCGQNTLPEIKLCVGMQDAAAEAEGLKFILHPQGKRDKADEKTPVTAVSFLIGPEGGFTDEEIELAKEHGFIPKKLGNLILRTETAGIAACAYAQALWGNF